jgi:hypothetical protein
MPERKKGILCRKRKTRSFPMSIARISVLTFLFMGVVAQEDGSDPTNQASDGSDQLDLGADGLFDEEEYNRAMAAIQQEKDEGTQFEQRDRVVKELMQTQLVEHFSEVDANGDGVLDYNEIDMR